MRRYRVDEHYPQLVAYLEDILKCHALAEDAAQEAYLKVYRATRWRRPSRARLYAAGERVAFDMLRRGKVRARPRENVPLLDATRVSDSALERLLQSEPLDKLEKFISELCQSQREVFRLRLKEEMSREDTARELGITVKAVELRTTRAMAYVRKRMKKLFGSTP